MSKVYTHLLRMFDLLNDVQFLHAGGPILTDLFLSHFRIKPPILVDAANSVFKSRPESDEAKSVRSTSFKSVRKLS